MKRLHLVAILFLGPIAAIIISGCGGGDDTDKPPKGSRSDRRGGGGEGERKAGGGGPRATGPLTALVTKGTATLKGKVTYDGTPPKLPDLTLRMKEHADSVRCLKGPTQDPTWMVDANKEVMNVVVWLRPLRGKFFKVPADQQKPQEVVIRQPYCAFDPHVVTLFPSFFDPDSKSQKPTGQVFKAVNDATMNHNTAWKGNNQFNTGKSETLRPKAEMVIDAKPCDKSRTGEDLIRINCDLHKWMTAFAWAFDHPYAAVTKEDGTYEIKNAPAGAEVELVYWHESMGDRPKLLEAITLKDGETASKDIKISK